MERAENSRSPEEQSHCKQPRYLKKKTPPPTTITAVRSPCGNSFLNGPAIGSQYATCCCCPISGLNFRVIVVAYTSRCVVGHVKMYMYDISSHLRHPTPVAAHLQPRTPPIISFEQDFEITSLRQSNPDQGFRYLHPNGSRNMRLN